MVQRIACLTVWIAALVCLANPVKALDKDMVTVEFLSSVNSAKVGEQFYLAASFSIKPTWHIYWKNPGDAGLATKIAVESSAEVKIGEIEWPLPERFEQGPIVGYGYAEKVVLRIPVTIEKSVDPSAAVDFTAKIRWLNCSGTLCVPDRKTLTLSVPIADGAKAAHEELFKTWEARLPQAIESSAAVGKYSSTGAVLGDGYSLQISWANPPHQVHLFPVIPNGLELDPVSVQTQGKESVVSIKGKVQEGLQVDALQMEAVLVVEDSTGNHAGVSVSIPLH